MPLLAETNVTLDGASLVTAAGTLGGLVSGAIGLAARALMVAMRQRTETEAKIELDRRNFEEGLIQKVTAAVVRFDAIDVEARKQNAEMFKQLVGMASSIASAMAATAESLRTLQATTSGVDNKIDLLANHHASHSRGTGGGRS